MDIHSFAIGRRVVKIGGKVVSDGPPPTPPTQEELAKLQADYDRTHPPGVDRVTGCC